jgi:5-methyltetrahydrofolate--homocysteine methyltransferase
MSIDIFKDKKILLSDGAWGTELAKRGLKPGICPELLNVDNPGAVRDVAASYVAAGADIIITNTFGGTPYKLEKYHLAGRLEELNAAGARLSVEAAGSDAGVFVSLGPSGEFLEPLGTVTESEMVAAFARQVAACTGTGIQGFVVETMNDLPEAICALKAVKDNSDCIAIVSMTYDRGVKGYATMMGVKPDQAALELERAGADIVGSNCGSGIDNMLEITRLMSGATDLPLWIKSNAGMPELVDGETVFRETPEYMASRVAELIEAGANIIGGCCGTTPDHIKAIRAILDSM